MTAAKCTPPRGPAWAEREAAPLQKAGLARNHVSVCGERFRHVIGNGNRQGERPAADLAFISMEW